MIFFLSMKSLFYFFERVNFLTAEFLLKKIRIDADNLKNVSSLDLFFVHMHNRNVPVNNVFLFLLTYVPFFKREVLGFYLKKKLFLDYSQKNKNYFKFKKANALFFKKNFLASNNFLKNNGVFYNSFFFFLIRNYVITKTSLNAIYFSTRSLSTPQVIYYFNAYIIEFFKKEQTNNFIIFLNENKIKDFWVYLTSVYANPEAQNLRILDPVDNLIQQSNSYADRPVEESEFKKTTAYSSLDVAAVHKSLFFGGSFGPETQDSSNTFILPLQRFSIFFTKKNYLYNKGKFSRNRQTYRTGVYLCIWLTVLTVVGLYFYFYLMSMKFTYFYLLFLFFLFLFFYKFFVKKNNKKFEEHANLFEKL